MSENLLKAVAEQILQSLDKPTLTPSDEKCINFIESLVLGFMLHFSFSSLGSVCFWSEPSVGHPAFYMQIGIIIFWKALNSQWLKWGTWKGKCYPELKARKSGTHINPKKNERQKWTAFYPVMVAFDRLLKDLCNCRAVLRSMQTWTHTLNLSRDSLSFLLFPFLF